MKRGIASIADVRARCDQDPVTHCWHWNGGRSGDGVPRIHTLDYRDLEKRSLSGPLALWMIAHGTVPRGLPFRRCVCRDCMNPAHLLLARSKKEIGAYIAKVGARKGTSVDKRRANLLLANAAAGIVPTPADVVLAIRSAPSSTTSKALAAQHGMAHQTVSRIRRGDSHKHLLEAA